MISGKSPSPKEMGLINQIEVYSEASRRAAGLLESLEEALLWAGQAQLLQQRLCSELLHLFQYALLLERSRACFQIVTA